MQLINASVVAGFQGEVKSVDPNVGAESRRRYISPARLILSLSSPAPRQLDGNVRIQANKRARCVLSLLGAQPGFNACKSPPDRIFSVSNLKKDRPLA